jgi:hypothetical protein
VKPLPHSSVVGLHVGSDILADTSLAALEEEYSSAHIVGRFNKKEGGRTYCNDTDVSSDRVVAASIRKHQKLYSGE